MMAAHYRVTRLRSNDGFAMVATLGVLSLLSVLVVTVFANAMASFRSGMIDLEKSRTYFAAEAAAESAMAQLALILEDAVIEDQELNSIVAPLSTASLLPTSASSGRELSRRSGSRMDRSLVSFPERR